MIVDAFRLGIAAVVAVAVLGVLLAATGNTVTIHVDRKITSLLAQGVEQTRIVGEGILRKGTQITIPPGACFSEDTKTNPCIDVNGRTAKYVCNNPSRYTLIASCQKDACGAGSGFGCRVKVEVEEKTVATREEKKEETNAVLCTNECDPSKYPLCSNKTYYECKDTNKDGCYELVSTPVECCENADCPAGTICENHKCVNKNVQKGETLALSIKKDFSVYPNKNTCADIYVFECNGGTGSLNVYLDAVLYKTCRSGKDCWGRFRIAPGTHVIRCVDSRGQVATQTFTVEPLDRCVVLNDEKAVACTQGIYKIEVIGTEGEYTYKTDNFSYFDIVKTRWEHVGRGGGYINIPGMEGGAGIYTVYDWKGEDRDTGYRYAFYHAKKHNIEKCTLDKGILHVEVKAGMSYQEALRKLCYLGSWYMADIRIKKDGDSCTLTVLEPCGNPQRPIYVNLIRGRPIIVYSDGKKQELPWREEVNFTCDKEGDANIYVGLGAPFFLGPVDYVMIFPVHFTKSGVTISNEVYACYNLPQSYPPRVFINAINEFRDYTTRKYIYIGRCTELPWS